MPNVAMKSVMTGGIIFFAIIIAYGLLATAPQPEQIEPEEVATAIRVIRIKKQSIQLEVLSQGNVLPRIQSELIPEVSGRVKWMSPKLVSGGYFDKDEILLSIDDRDYRSSVARHQARVTRAKAEDEHARFELRRMQELVKNKLTSQSSLENALRNERVAQATLVEARISLEQAQRDLWRTEIRAPYEGLVRTERVDLGQFITRGQSVASIYASDSVEVRLPVADRQLAYLDLPLGYRGELTDALSTEVVLSTTYGGQRYEWIGKLVRTEAEIDSKSRMINAIVRVDNKYDDGHPPLPIGLFVAASIKGRTVDNIVSLPRAALRNQNQVLIVDKNNRLRYRSVEVMRFEKDKVIISAGLEDGEVVSISPIQTVVDGMRVEPVFADQGDS
ncbi:MAG: efflux RND transporter periplasmic adaptor subunit [Proteobacteria bacterium]|nr:efflux RND transporter periplasmic adaptor subunit [Pseudomonadota bacterium]